MMKGNCIAGCAVAIAIGAAWFVSTARAGEYSRGGTFILPGWDARGAALGGAATILIRDERSAYWNPANLTLLRSPRVSLGTMQPVPDLDNRYTILCAGMSFLEFTADGREPSGLDSTVSADSARMAGGMVLSEATVPRRRVAIAVCASHLGLDLAEGSSWNESTIGLAGAYAPTPRTSLGITIRWMKSWSDAADADSWGASFDAGAAERITEHAWLAVTGKNILSRVSYPERTDTLDATWSVALAYEDLLDRISIECDAVIKYGVINRFLAGMEVIVAPGLLSILGGVDVRLTEGERVIPSIGLATTYGFAEISLASSFDPQDAFGRLTRVSLSFRL
jgi:hypothetical protein